MAKKVFFNQEAKESLQKGINTVANAAGSTLGYGGKTVIISSGYGHMPQTTKDGVTVVRSMFLGDEIENTGVMLMRGAAEKQLELCGDGTTTTVVMAQSILNNGMDAIANKKNVQEIKSGIDKAVNCVVAELKKMSVAVDNNAMINNIATISANNDAFIGGLIAEAYDKIGLNGLLTIEDSKTVETYIEVMEGAEIPCGWTAKEFVTDNDKMLTIYENPNIMVLDYEVKSFKQLEPVLNKIQASDAVSTPLIIVARGFDGEPFNTMVVNRVRNKIPVCLVKAPTAYQKESFIDLAALTGANVICDEAGLKIENTELSDFGTCKKIIISNKNTLIIGGNTNKEALNQIKHEISVQRNDTSNDLLKEILDKRIARLTGSVAVIYVGGKTVVETKERKDRVDDAVRAVKSAIEEGVVVGGGVALIRCIGITSNLFSVGDESVGIDLIIGACKAPLQKMLENAGIEKSILWDVINLRDNEGYNVKTAKMCDLFLHGIIDPVKVVRCALENASSVASQVIGSDVLLVEMKEM